MAHFTITCSWLGIVCLSHVRTLASSSSSGKTITSSTSKAEQCYCVKFVRIRLIFICWIITRQCSNIPANKNTWRKWQQNLTERHHNCSTDHPPISTINEYHCNNTVSLQSHITSSHKSTTFTPHPSSFRWSRVLHHIWHRHRFGDGLHSQSLDWYW